jgi:hypothetical protein
MAHVQHVARESDIAGAVEALGLGRPRPVLVVVGGADSIGSAMMAELETLFVDELIPAIEGAGACVVDGGTHAGVMRVIGDARRLTSARFPLLGVVAEDVLGSRGNAVLDSDHTHFMMVPGRHWGDESWWISAIASDICGSRGSVTLLVGGGRIAIDDVINSQRAQREVVVVAGTGGLADQLDDVAPTAVPGSTAPTADGPIHTIDPFATPGALRGKLDELLGTRAGGRQ